MTLREPDGCDIALGVSADVNDDGIPDECQALPDLNGDGNVNVADLLAMLDDWGACPDPPSPKSCLADFNGDGTVGVPDLLLLLEPVMHFGQGLPMCDAWQGSFTPVT